VLSHKTSLPYGVETFKAKQRTEGAANCHDGFAKYPHLDPSQSRLSTAKRPKSELGSRGEHTAVNQQAVLS